MRMYRVVLKLSSLWWQITRGELEASHGEKGHGSIWRGIVTIERTERRGLPATYGTLILRGKVILKSNKTFRVPSLKNESPDGKD